MAQQVQDNTYEVVVAAAWAMFKKPDHVNPEDVWECKTLFQEFREEILKRCNHGALLPILYRAQERALQGETAKVYKGLLRCKTLTPRKNFSRPSLCAACVHNTVLVKNHAEETQMMTRESLRDLDNAHTIERFLQQTDLMLQSRLEELCWAVGTTTHT